MPNNTAIPAQQSLLNRLHNEQRQPHPNVHQHQKQHQREWQQVIQRDLEFLLNTKCPLPPQINTLEWVKHSAIQFGMIDFMEINYASNEGKQQLSQCIRQCIETFEPRLQHCSVEIEDNSEFGALLSIHISAEMSIMNQPKPIYFETLLQPEQAQFTVRKGLLA